MPTVRIENDPTVTNNRHNAAARPCVFVCNMIQSNGQPPTGRSQQRQVHNREKTQMFIPLALDG